MSVIASHLATIESLFAGSTTGLGEFVDCVLARSSTGAPIPLLQQAQQLGCVLTEEIERQLTKTIAEVEASLGKLDGDTSHAETLRDALQLLHPDEAQRVPLLKQLHHRVLGLLYAVQAASQWPQPGELDQATTDSPWVRALHRCGQHWDAAWLYPFSDSKHNHVPGNGLTEVGRVDAAMLHADQHDWLKRTSGQNWSRHCTTWLTVRRLLRFLLSERDDKHTREQSVPVLLVTRHDDRVQDDQSQGQVRGLALQLRNEGDTGWYLDPVAFGAAVFDQSLQLSFELAGRLSYSTLKGQTAAAIRLTPATYPNIKTTAGHMFLVSGNSAGGLVGCGLYALAQGQKLTEKLTASVGFTLKPGKDLTEGLLVTAADIECTAVGGAVPKLISASQAGLQGVALHSQNKQDIDSFRKKPEAASCATQTADSFAELYEYLTQGHELEQRLDQIANAIHAEWSQIEEATDESREVYRDTQDEHRFDRYIWPDYHIEIPESESQRESRLQQRDVPPSEPVPGEDEAKIHFLLRRLISGPKSLVIYDQAGAGKTVFSWRVRHELTSPQMRKELFNGHAPLVIRCDGAWPVDSKSKQLCDLQQLLHWQLSSSVKDASQRQQLIEHALRHRRVVVILDGFDQFTAAAQQHVVDMLTNRTDLAPREQCHWIITSRVHTLDALRHLLFDDRHWTRVRIELFTREQQDEYFTDIGNRWLETVPNRDAVADLLALPVVLRLIRRLIEETPADQSLPVFRTLSELFVMTSRLLLQRAIEKSSDLLERAGLNAGKLKAADQLQLLEQVLCLLAFQMMLDKNYNGLLDDGPEQAIREFEQRASDRFFRNLNHELQDNKLTASRRRMLERELDDKLTEWDWALDVLKTIELNHRAVTEAYGTERLAFRNRKIMECYAARYLTAYANQGDLTGSPISNDPSLQTFVGDPEWTACWELALSMPADTLNSVVTTASLHILFSPPVTHPRPTRLMFMAWQGMTRNELPGREPVLATYRQQFRDILGGSDLDRARVASELWLEQDVIDHFSPPAPTGRSETEQQRWERQRPGREKLNELRPGIVDVMQSMQCREASAPAADRGQLAYSFCSDATKPDRWWNEVDEETRRTEYTDTDWLHFMMGDVNEPWQPEKIPAFYMATTCVTVGQYRLFDAQRVEDVKKEYGIRIPSDDCPMIGVDWYDAFCLTLWLGDEYQLPGEVHWEGAAWGGIPRRKHIDFVIGVQPFTDAFTSEQVNFNGNHPMSGPKSDYRGKTVPVREFEANGFGLYQMSGNVWEWCQSVWKDSLQEAIERRKDSVVDTNVQDRRCVRGGSWYSNARYCRCSDRYRVDADIRFNYLGFRLSRTK